MRVAAFTYVGDDEWADVIRRRYAAEGIDTAYLLTHPERATSTSAVLIDPSGERSFLHCAGAPRMLDKQAMLGRLDLFAKSRVVLLGYYPLMTRLQGDLPEVFAAIRAAGCLTALDAAGDGGTMDQLAPILQHLDFYVPNETEAANQTGLTEPREMIQAYRDAGARGWLGIKLGERGALISPQPGEVIAVAVVKPPRPVVDTTGAGDCFYGALLAGVLRGLPPADAGRLAAAAGAFCVTGLGATSAVRGYDETAHLAGLK
jgi:sugar/nucleoside kinase (ribokinase family)